MSGKHYLPRAQNKMKAWSAQFNTYIAAHRQRLNLTAEEVADYNDKHTAMTAVMAAMNNPRNRGPAWTQEKNDAVAAVRKAARKLAAQIRANREVTLVDRLMMGLPLRKPGGGGARLPRPTTAPIVSVKAINGQQIEIQLRDRFGSGRAKPRAVARAALYYHIGDSPPATGEPWRMQRWTSRTKFVFNVPPHVQAGEIVWVTARWANPRCEEGPFAKPACTMMPLGAHGVRSRAA